MKVVRDVHEFLVGLVVGSTYQQYRHISTTGGVTFWFYVPDKKYKKINVERGKTWRRKTRTLRRVLLSRSTLVLRV